MQKLFAILLLGAILSGCAWVSRMDIEQGNVITPEKVHELRLGMTMRDVKEIMGSPILMNTFNNNRVDYIYTFKPGNGKMTEQYITLEFNKKGILKNITGNIKS